MMLMVMETGRGVSIFYFSNFCKTNNYIFSFLFLFLFTVTSPILYFLYLSDSPPETRFLVETEYSFSEFVYVWEILVANSTLKSLSCRCSYKIWSPRYVLSILAINVEFYLSEGDFLFLFHPCILFSSPVFHEVSQRQSLPFHSLRT